MSFKMHITCVGLFSFLWIKLSTTFDITGGNFQKDVYKDSYVIIAENNVGPKMCVNDCFLHKGCNGVVFVPNELLCKLLSISYPEDKLLARSGFYLSEIDSWEKQASSCWPNPCQERTKCVVARNRQHICVRFDVYCDNHACKNGATCRNSVDNYICLCSNGYHGQFCQNRYCDNYLCQNGATYRNLDNSYTCLCSNGYHGQFCQNRYCDYHLCQNGATCRNLDNSYTCLCSNGYHGQFCQYRYCDNHWCQNGATCRNLDNSYTCSCTIMFSGKYCEKRNI